MARLAELGREGVLLLCGDSTNADRPGISTSESVVGPNLEQIFARARGRIVVTCFASNIHRVQQVVHAAAALDRKVALVGRSMRKNGQTLEVDERGARRGGRETAGMVFVDGVDIGDVADVALRDRRMLSADGIFIIVATVSEQDGSSVVPPEVLARGVPFLDGNSGFIDDLREAVEDSLDRAAEQRITEVDVMESFLHDDLAAFIYDRLRRRPMVLPVVVEV